MAKTSPAAIKPIQLSAEAAEQFDRMVREKSKARKAFGHDKKAKEAKAAVIEAMGEATFAALPDGRLIQRLAKSRNMPPQKASVQSWEDLIETTGAS